MAFNGFTMFETPDSSNVHSFGYDAETQSLRVCFRRDKTEPGDVYEYVKVDPLKHAAMTGAESIGRYLNEHIKPHHKARKMQADEL